MKRNKSKLLAAVLAVVMIAMLVPVNAFADDGVSGTLAGGNYWNGTESKAFNTSDLVIVDEGNVAAATIAAHFTAAPYEIAIPYGTTLKLADFAEDTAAPAATKDAPFGIITNANAKAMYLAKANATTAQINLVTGAAGTNAAAVATQDAEIGDYIVIFDGTSPDDATDAAGATIKYAVFQIVQSDSGTISGDPSVKNPIYNVAVSTTLAYALDPLAVGVASGDDAENTQISSPVFAFTNATKDVPVRVTVELTAGGDAIAGLQGSDFVPTDAQGAVKNFSLGIVGASSVTGTPTVSDPDGNGAKFVQAPLGDKSTIRYFDKDNNKKATIDFLLAPSGNGTALNATAPDNGVGIFKLYARMETYPTVKWTAADITVGGVYNFTGIKATDYAIKDDAAAVNDTWEDDPATKFDESTNTSTIDPDVSDHPAWKGGLKGTTSRADATEVVGVNVMPVAVTPDGSEEAPYVLTAGTSRSFTFTIPTGETNVLPDLYFKLSGVAPGLTALGATGGVFEADVDTTGKVFVQLVRPEQTVFVLPDTDIAYSNTTGVLHFNTPVYAGTRTINIVTPGATYRFDYVAAVETPPATPSPSPAPTTGP
jgi:uncharacterized membrane protein YeaQ/YmgE (transglycosylase-associated protein family)